MSRHQFLVLPIFRHYWLWESLAAQAARQQTPRKALADWRTGENLEAKFHLLGKHISRWVRRGQWRDAARGMGGALWPVAPGGRAGVASAAPLA